MIWIKLQVVSTFGFYGNFTKRFNERFLCTTYTKSPMSLLSWLLLFRLFADLIFNLVWCTRNEEKVIKQRHFIDRIVTWHVLRRQKHHCPLWTTLLHFVDHIYSSMQFNWLLVLILSCIRVTRCSSPIALAKIFAFREQLFVGERKCLEEFFFSSRAVFAELFFFVIVWLSSTALLEFKPINVEWKVLTYRTATDCAGC